MESTIIFLDKVITLHEEDASDPLARFFIFMIERAEREKGDGLESITILGTNYKFKLKSQVTTDKIVGAIKSFRNGRRSSKN